MMGIEGDMTKKKLVIKDLVKTFSSGKVAALKGVSFDVNKGEFFAVIGPSGCGKTTLLRCVSGLEVPDSGSICIDGVDVGGIPPNRRDISLVFQDMALFPHMRVFDNIAFGLRMLKHPKDQVEKEVDEVMKLVALEGLGDRYPRQLSGGQQQRVALARSLVLKPSVLLFDEPLGNLDLRLQKEMLVELKLLHQKIGFTALYVTHDQEQAMMLADSIVVMNMGVIEQIGTPDEIYLNPSTVFVSRFVGRINMLRGEARLLDKIAIAKTEVGDFEAPLKEGLLQGMTVAYTIRPERVLVGDNVRDCENRIKAKLISQIYKGSEMEYVAQLSNGVKFKALTQGVSREVKLGEDVLLGWYTEDAVVIAKPSVVEGLDIDRVILGE